MKQQIFLTDLPNEVWKDISGFEGQYQVSNLGRVKSLYSKKNVPTLRKLSHNITTGYVMVSLMDMKQKMHLKSVHRLVAIAFMPNPMSKTDVNHINGIKTDNRLSNLEWNTRSENMFNGYKIGVIPKQIGEGNPRSKLLEVNILDIRASSLSNVELAKMYSVTSVTIKDVRKGKIWKHLLVSVK